MADYRRSIILIDKPFQLRFCIYVCLWLLAICFIYPLIFSNLFEYFIRYLAADPNGPEVAAIIKTRQDVMSLLVLSEVVFIAMTFLICLFISHRIAGPIYKLRKTFHEFAEGKFRSNLKFRHKDYFSDLATDFNEMTRVINEKQDRETEVINDAMSHIEKALSTAQGEVKASLEPAFLSLKKLQEDRVEPRHTIAQAASDPDSTTGESQSSSTSS